MLAYQVRPMRPVFMAQGTAASNPPPPAGAGAPPARPGRAVSSKTLAIVGSAVGLGAGGFAAWKGLRAKRGNGTAAKAYIGSMTVVGMITAVVSLGILGYTVANQ